MAVCLRGLTIKKTGLFLVFQGQAPFFCGRGGIRLSAFGGNPRPIGPACHRFALSERYRTRTCDLSDVSRMLYQLS